MRFKRFLVCLLCVGMIFQNVNIPALAQPADAEVILDTVSEEESVSVSETESSDEAVDGSVTEDVSEEADSSMVEESASGETEDATEVVSVETVEEATRAVEETVTEEITTVEGVDVAEDGESGDETEGIMDGYSLELSQDNTYYINDSYGLSQYKYPVFFSVTGFASSSEYKNSDAEIIIGDASVEIGNRSYYVSGTDSYTGYYIVDMAEYATEGTQDITIHVSNGTTGEDIVNVIRAVTFEKYPVEYGGAITYASVDQASISFPVKAYNTFMEEDAENYPSTSLIDSEGNEVAAGKFSKTSYNAKIYNKNDNRYGDGLPNALKVALRSYGGYSYYYTYTPESKLTAGSYDVKVVDGNGQTTLLENVIRVSEGCLITDYYDLYGMGEGSYDPQYLDIRVSGYNIDSEQIRPAVYSAVWDEEGALYTKGDTLLSEVESIDKEENTSNDENLESYIYRLKYTGEGKWSGTYIIVMASEEGYSFTSKYDEVEMSVEVPDTYTSYTVNRVTFSPGYYESWGDIDEEGNEIYEYVRNDVYGDYIKLIVETSSGIAVNDAGIPHIYPVVYSDAECTKPISTLEGSYEEVYEGWENEDYDEETGDLISTTYVGNFRLKKVEPYTYWKEAGTYYVKFEKLYDTITLTDKRDSYAINFNFEAGSCFTPGGAEAYENIAYPASLKSAGGTSVSMTIEEQVYENGLTDRLELLIAPKADAKSLIAGLVKIPVTAMEADSNYIILKSPTVGQENVEYYDPDMEETYQYVRTFVTFDGAGSLSGNTEYDCRVMYREDDGYYYFLSGIQNFATETKWEYVISQVSGNAIDGQIQMSIGDTLAVNMQMYPEGEAENLQTVSANFVSSNTEAATVENGVITAVNAGLTKITATVSDGVTKEFTVLVVPEDKSVILNTYKTLGDISLWADGFAWKNPELSLAGYNGRGSAKFPVVYTDSEGAEYEGTVGVNYARVAMLKTNVTNMTLLVGDAQGFGVWLCDNNGEIIPGGYVYRHKAEVTVTSSNTKVATVSGNSTMVTAVAKGSAKIDYEVKFSDGSTVKTTVNVTVKDGNKAETTALYIGGEEFAGEKYTANLSDGKLLASLGVDSDYKVTWTSSDPKVASITKLAAETKDDVMMYPAEVIFKSSGYTTITATVNDTLKTTKSFVLYVNSPVPNLLENTVTLNKEMKQGAYIQVLLNEGYTLDGIKLLDARSGTESTVFGATEVSEGKYEVYLLAKNVSEVKNTSYKLQVVPSVSDGQGSVAVDEKLALTVKVNGKKPSITVKQQDKMNTFYKDAEAVFKVTTTEVVEDVIVDSDLYNSDYDPKTGLLTLDPVAEQSASLTKNDLKNIEIKVQTADYKDWETNITIKTQNKKPSLVASATKVTMYPVISVNEGIVVINEKTTKLPTTLDYDVDFTNDLVTADQTDANEITFALTDAGKAVTKNTTVKAKMKLTNDNWMSPVDVSVSVVINTKKPTLKLAKNSVTLNNHFGGYEQTAVALTLKDCPQVFADAFDVTITPDDKAKAFTGEDKILPVYDKLSGNVVVTLGANASAVGKGNYKYTVIADLNGTPASATLTVKVVDTAPLKAVALKVSGTIDPINRDTTAITVKPTYKAVTGTISDVVVTGEEGYLFDADVVNGSVVIAANDGVALFNKTYVLKTDVTLENDGEELEISGFEIKVKVKQSTPKASAVLSSKNIYSSAKNSVYMTVSAVDKNKNEEEIEKISLVNDFGIFGFDAETGEISVENVSGLKKGKNYTLKFNVHYEGQAVNAKDKVVSAKISIK